MAIIKYDSENTERELKSKVFLLISLALIVVAATVAYRSYGECMHWLVSFDGCPLGTRVIVYLVKGDTMESRFEGIIKEDLADLYGVELRSSAVNSADRIPQSHGAVKELFFDRTISSGRWILDVYGHRLDIMQSGVELDGVRRGNTSEPSG